MVEASEQKECSFFLVQYVPDLVRGEFLNIGVFLYSPREKYLGCLFTNDFRRIQRIHPQADLELLRELQQHFEREIDERGNDLEGYIRFIQESFSNLIQITPQRTFFLNDPQTAIHELFERYVGARWSGPPPRDTRLWIKQRLTAAFVRAGVWDQLDKRISVEPWTQKGDRFTFDYGYRALRFEGKPNGHMKFVHALSLKRDTKLAKELVYTLDRVRRKEAADLTAVIEDSLGEDDEGREHTRRILEEGRASLQPLSGVDEYAQSVRRELGD